VKLLLGVACVAVLWHLLPWWAFWPILFIAMMADD
jgi:hypothetical protein